MITTCTSFGNSLWLSLYEYPSHLSSYLRNVAYIYIYIYVHWGMYSPVPNYFAKPDFILLTRQTFFVWTSPFSDRQRNFT